MSAYVHMSTEVIKKITGSLINNDQDMQLDLNDRIYSSILSLAAQRITLY